MPTANDFRRIALGLTGAIEAAHMNHPDFRVAGKIFATLHQDDQFGMVVLTPEEQARFVRDHAAAFAPENGAWGRQGCTRVRLASVDEDTLGEAMTIAWQHTINKAQARGAKKRPTGAAKKPAARRAAKKSRR